MTSQPIRDPSKDHLLTPQNSALIISITSRCLRSTRWLSVAQRPRDPRTELPADDIEAGGEQQAEDCYAYHAEENGNAEGLSHLGTWAFVDHQRQSSQDECHRCHENRPKSLLSSSFGGGTT